MSSTQLRNIVLLALVVVALASSLATAWRTRDWGGLVLNLSTEMIGAVATYLLFELFIRRREELEARKADLIAQMGSSIKDVAIAAAEEVVRHGWHTDGSLQGAHLVGANLQGAYLFGANLQGAYLVGANLQGAYLFGANLQEAYLGEANLQEAYLWGANLQGARLWEANLQGAYLERANLQGAYLFTADLQGATLRYANLQDAKFNVYAILPDGTKWTPGTDTARFTDPNHPDFWSPEE